MAIRTFGLKTCINHTNLVIICMPLQLKFLAMKLASSHNGNHTFSVIMPYAIAIRISSPETCIFSQLQSYYLSNNAACHGN